MEQLLKKKNILFYCAYFCYLLATVMQSTMYTEYSLAAKCFVLMRYLACAIAGFKIAMDLYLRWSREDRSGLTKWYQANSVKRGIVYGILVLVIGLASFVPDDRSLVFVVVLLLATDGLDIERVLKSTLYVQIVLMIAIVVSSTFGIIPDLLFKRTDIPIRHSLGYTYPSVMMSYFCFLIFLYLWVKDCQITAKELAIIELVNYLLFLLTDCRTSFLLILAGAPLCWFSDKYTRMFSKLDMMKNVRSVPAVKRICAHIFDYLAVYLSAFLLVLCGLLPKNSVAQLIDRALNGRITYMVRGMEAYGIHLFGKDIAWVGFGGSSNTEGLWNTYNFVDCSYGYILLNFGIILFILTLVLLVCINKSIRKSGNPGKMLLLLMVLGYCFIEPRLLELQMNPFLLLIAPVVGSNWEQWKPLATRKERGLGLWKKQNQ